MRGYRDCAEELRVSEICWDLAAAPWPSSALVLARAVELLPTIDDGAILDLVEQLALAVVERDEELKAVRAVQSAALDDFHNMHEENTRLRQRLAEARPTKQSTAKGPDSSRWRLRLPRPRPAERTTRPKAKPSDKHIRET